MVDTFYNLVTDIYEWGWVRTPVSWPYLNSFVVRGAKPKRKDSTEGYTRLVLAAADSRSVFAARLFGAGPLVPLLARRQGCQLRRPLATARGGIGGCH
eukprot:scaffold1235_cov358-Prasinococcus_capsulatus_cf.AAC.7